jgi:methyl-accepting chemotaxis protein
MNEKFENALIELETSLKEIDSAAKQVEDIKGASTGVIKKSSELINEVRSRIGRLKENFSDWLNELDKNTKVLFKNYETIWKKHNAEVEKLIEVIN